MAFFDDLLARVRALPGVDAVSLVRAVPGEGYFGERRRDHRRASAIAAGADLTCDVRWADPGYFASLRIPFLRGRTFGSDQRLDGAKEAIISAEFARQYFK